MNRFWIILFSIVLVPSFMMAAGPEWTGLPEEKDWDRILDRYESLCDECIEMKAKTEAGEKVSGASVSRLIGILSSLKKELKDGAGKMSPVQWKRFESIKTRYSAYFGEKPDSGSAVTRRQDDVQERAEEGKPQFRAPVQVKNTAATPRTEEEDPLPSIAELTRRKPYLPETRPDKKMTLQKVFCLKEPGLSYAEPARLKEETVPADEGGRKLCWTVAVSASIIPDFACGAAVSIASRASGWGGYAKFLSNFHSTSSSYECLSDGSYSGGTIWPDGNTSLTKMKISIGGRKTFGRHFGVYAGTGYGKAEKYWKDISGQWASVSDISVSGVLAECGALFCFGPVEFSLGVSSTSFQYTDMELSVGIRF
ncbi:MAG: hypothetical protein ACI3ZC_05605 [Candidatus Cryptobacteroides sp.]